ncbi:Flap-structured DNA-binding and RNA-binding protein [Stygiomarasmius scandens]|uniref:Flap-structured DNA-binding and RNA-binding protein n=1 Tax=Marasmiellus scandens TaxID=2682957 RepID=A0ABR1KBX2_9AGAR
MLSAQPSPKPKFPSELSPSALRSPGNLLSPRPGSGFVVPASPRFGGTGESLDQWFHDLQKYEKTLGAMAAASEDPKFREELGTIEQWFKMLTESEQTASLYTLLQHTNPAQIKFLMAVLQQMSDAIPPDNSGPKQTSRSLRPPNLNLPLPGTPSTPHFSASASSAQTSEQSAQELVVKEEPTSWANMVSTPHDLMFKKSAGVVDQQSATMQMQNIQNLINSAGSGMGMQMNPMNMTMLTAMGFSNEQIVAMQLVMRGLAQPVDAVPAGNTNGQGQKNSQHHHGHGQRRSNNNNHSNTSNNGNTNWRAPGARFPGSALRNGPKSAGPKSGGPKSSGLGSATSTGGTPKTEDDVDPELLKDVPAWLKSLRLHKYTDCFQGMSWEQIVVLDEAALEAKGVVALGARRRLTRTFEVVKKKMGMATTPTTDAPPASAAPATNGASLNSATFDLNAPHSAAPIL